MRRAYVQMDSAGWVQKNYKREMSPLGKEVAQVLGVVGEGFTNVEKVNRRSGLLARKPLQLGRTVFGALVN